MARVQLPDGIAAFIAAQVARLAADPHQPQTGALPVYGDIGGGMGIRPDGEVISWMHDDESVVTPVDDYTWLLTALVVGARQYPELRPLLPKRGERDADCWCWDYPPCASGKIICGTCGGLGWLPADRPGA